MTLLTEDFVNREEQLATLRKIIHQEVDQRILLIRGPKGIGKTYLLDEFRAECEAEGIDCARMDFAERSDQNYMTTVLSVWNQLGPDGFEHLAQTIAGTRALGAWETVPTAPAAVRVEHSAANPVPSGRRSGGVDFYEAATIHGDVVGRDAYYVTQIIQRDDPWVQQVIQADITAAFRDCLVELTTTRMVAFLLDSWERATTDIRDWLCRNLLKWILDKKLSNALAVVAGTEVPDLGRPMRRSGRLALDRLPDEAVRTYWIEKCNLPPEDVTNIIKYSRGNPMVMALMADERAMALEFSG
jgi:hypothetical protein